jgi:hypothetical protein
MNFKNFAPREYQEAIFKIASKYISAGELAEINKIINSVKI